MHMHIKQEIKLYRRVWSRLNFLVRLILILTCYNHSRILFRWLSLGSNWVPFVQCATLNGTFRRRVHNIDNTMLRNVGSHLPEYTASYSRSQKNHHSCENLETPVVFPFLKIQQNSTTEKIHLFI